MNDVGLVKIGHKFLEKKEKKEKKHDIPEATVFKGQKSIFFGKKYDDDYDQIIYIGFVLIVGYIIWKKKLI